MFSQSSRSIATAGRNKRRSIYGTDASSPLNRDKRPKISPFAPIKGVTDANPGLPANPGPDDGVAGNALNLLTHSQPVTTLPIRRTRGRHTRHASDSTNSRASIPTSLGIGSVEAMERQRNSSTIRQISVIPNRGVRGSDHRHYVQSDVIHSDSVRFAERTTSHAAMPHSGSDMSTTSSDFTTDGFEFDQIEGVLRKRVGKRKGRALLDVAQDEKSLRMVQLLTQRLKFSVYFKNAFPVDQNNDDGLSELTEQLHDELVRRFKVPHVLAIEQKNWVYSAPALNDYRSANLVSRSSAKVFVLRADMLLWQLLDFAGISSWNPSSYPLINQIICVLWSTVGGYWRRIALCSTSGT